MFTTATTILDVKAVVKESGLKKWQQRLEAVVIVDSIYTTELQLHKANSSDTEVPFLDLNLNIFNGTVSTKIYDKRDDFDFDIVNFPFQDGDVLQGTSSGVYVYQLIRFARASSNLVALTAVIKPLLPIFISMAIVILNLVRCFRNSIADTVPLVEKYNVGLKTLL